MVDIAAHLSLTSSGSAIDLSANRGAETADTRAFGNILAGQVQANGDTGAPAAPLRPFPAPAGNRQPDGKILPGAAQILPDTAPLSLEAPAVQVGTAEPKPIEGSPVHGLIKLLTAALTGQHPAAEQATDEAPAKTETVSADADTGTDTDTGTSEQATPIAALALAMVQFALPILTLPVTPAPQAVAAEAPHAATGGPAPILVPTTAQRADPALREQMHAALAQFIAQPLQSVAPTDAPAVPVLTVAATPGDTPAPVVTLVSAPALPVGQTISAQIKVAAEAKDNSFVTTDRPVAVLPQLAGRDVAIETPVAASRTAPAVRTVLAERTGNDLAAAPVTPGSQPQFAAAPAVSAPAPGTSAPVVEMPRQDFAALVDRLVEARNTSVSQSTHASLNHAEFGQVSLHFQQDGDDLKVGMSSADPDFARAAQAAQALKPAERQNFTADTNARGQNSSQAQTSSQGETGNSSFQSHSEAAKHFDQQNRNGQGRNSRGGGSNTSNPSPRWAGGDQPQSRGGIFA
ncbi:MAG: hypothetical protein JWQ16_3144 [Novosphingobium sp.]|nr:hypothetical protein [Novosphingobium sp.]